MQNIRLVCRLLKDECDLCLGDSPIGQAFIFHLQADFRMPTAPRSLPLAVISDVHLGTYGCQAEALLQYLRSIRPQVLVLNGDILDIWQLSKSYFPDSHLLVVRELLQLMERGTEVYYITGNHDEALRKFADTSIGRLRIANKALLHLDGKKAWFFHGDVFDVTMQHSKWLAKLGAKGYGLLILLNKFVNFMLRMAGQPKVSLSKQVKNGVKKAVKSKNNFEQTAADIAIDKGYDYVICGHIHKPEIKSIQNEKGEVLYLNSGDWVEHLSALEYDQGQWTLYRHAPGAFPERSASADAGPALDNKSLFQAMMQEFALQSA
jgi:UDP-2,3-diacylglucosamine pyrophosphatase LpxH